VRQTSYKWIISTLYCIYVLTGCAGVQYTGPSGDLKTGSSIPVFKSRVNNLIESIQKNLKNTPYENYQSYVTAESLIKGEQYTELEAHLVDNLKKSVPKTYQELTRQNWFELRENARLSADHLLDVIVLHVRRDNILKKVDVHVSLRGSDGNEIYRNLGEVAFDYGPGSIARTMDLKPSHHNPFPKGLPENPYREIEKFAFGLTRELVDRYRKTGAKSDQGRVADNEIRVYINM